MYFQHGGLQTVVGDFIVNEVLKLFEKRIADYCIERIGLRASLVTIVDERGLADDVLFGFGVRIQFDVVLFQVGTKANIIRGVGTKGSVKVMCHILARDLACNRRCHINSPLPLSVKFILITGVDTDHPVLRLIIMYFIQERRSRSCDLLELPCSG